MVYSKAAYSPNSILGISPQSQSHNFWHRYIIKTCLTEHVHCRWSQYLYYVTVFWRSTDVVIISTLLWIHIVGCTVSTTSVLCGNILLLIWCPQRIHSVMDSYSLQSALVGVIRRSTSRMLSIAVNPRSLWHALVAIHATLIHLLKMSVMIMKLHAYVISWAGMGG